MMLLEQWLIKDHFSVENNDFKVIKSKTISISRISTSKCLYFCCVLYNK